MPGSKLECDRKRETVAGERSPRKYRGLRGVSAPFPGHPPASREHTHLSGGFSGTDIFIFQMEGLSQKDNSVENQKRTGISVGTK